METLSGPLLTVYEIRRATAVGLASKKIHVAQLGAEEARWVADLEYLQDTPRGIVHTPVIADIYAIGLDDAFSSDRGLEARITSTDKNNPFIVEFSVKEAPARIAYIARRALTIGLRVDHSIDPSPVSYRLKEPLQTPRQITPADISYLSDPRSLPLNQTMLASISRLTGIPLIVPRVQE